MLFTAVFFPVAVLAGCFFAPVFYMGFGSLPPAEPVSIPYKDTSLPGYLVSPQDASGPLPTLIVNNGGDGPESSALTLLGAPAVARGFRALLFDGPGQQSMLFAHGVPFRPDWENVVTPVVDVLLARPTSIPGGSCWPASARPVTGSRAHLPSSTGSPPRSPIRRSPRGGQLVAQPAPGPARPVRVRRP
ncbi:hypothetical protein ACQPXS_02440 [Streptomyces sp. CA-142005]|uniref:hypothetical protein n=1 Tax=Streptomyces sp. CA-142005 TaxID=3240052 RepID=UPI003D90CA7F